MSKVVKTEFHKCQGIQLCPVFHNIFSSASENCQQVGLYGEQENERGGTVATILLLIHLVFKINAHYVSILLIIDANDISCKT